MLCSSSPCTCVARGSRVCGIGTISHLRDVNGNLFLGELHWEALSTLREDVLHSFGALAEGIGVSFVLQGIRDTEKIFRRQVSAPASQAALMEHRGCSLALYSWKFSSYFLLILEIGKNWWWWECCVRFTVSCYCFLAAFIVQSHLFRSSAQPCCSHSWAWLFLLAREVPQSITAPARRRGGRKCLGKRDSWDQWHWEVEDGRG